MKYTLHFLLAFLILSTTACKKNDNTANPTYYYYYNGSNASNFKGLENNDKLTEFSNTGASFSLVYNGILFNVMTEQPTANFTTDKLVTRLIISKDGKQIATGTLYTQLYLLYNSVNGVSMYFNYSTAPTTIVFDTEGIFESKTYVIN